MPVERDQQGMQPIDETQRVDELFGPFSHGERDLLEFLQHAAADVRAVVPDCVGLSYSMLEDGVTFTLVATGDEAALLDAVQYVVGGPCVGALERRDVISGDEPGALAGRWPAFALAAGVSGIKATLSLPAVSNDRVVGFNLYAATEHAFDGHHDELATLLGARADEASIDADLRFESMQRARNAPRLMQDATRLHVAAATLARSGHLTMEQAERRLRDASVRAAVPLAALVDRMLQIQGRAEE